jgi:TRAP-type C4-dicarboxylate transport system permease small subunit
MLSKLKWSLQTATRFICSACMFILIPLMLLTTIDVIGRSLFLQPIPGGVEISSYMLAIFVLAGLAYTQQVRGNVQVEFFISRLPLRPRSALNALTGLLSLFVVGLITWQGAIETLHDTKVSDMLRIPRWPFKSLVPLAGSLLCLELAIEVLENLAKALGRGSHD